jgi:hypothetical protein
MDNFVFHLDPPPKYVCHNNLQFSGLTTEPYLSIIL